jgi:hypothetical protein
MTLPMVILGRRHGVNPADDPVIIAGPSHAHVALTAQFKREFCHSREHPDFEKVWLCSLAEEKSVKFTKSEAPKAELKEGKKKK